MLKDYVVFDLETTGLSPEKDTMIEIGALKVIQGKVADRFSEFINPHQKLTEQISELTGITDEMLAGARDLQAVVSDFVDFCEDYVVVGHNLGFDYRFTKMAAEKFRLPFSQHPLPSRILYSSQSLRPSPTHCLYQQLWSQSQFLMTSSLTELRSVQTYTGLPPRSVKILPPGQVFPLMFFSSYVPHGLSLLNSVNRQFPYISCYAYCRKHCDSVTPSTMFPYILYKLNDHA